jgi:bifunctional DNA-binding transcriptional regulator/antitoxin component of YhaV-PrlF toxin-antitoxin module
VVYVDMGLDRSTEYGLSIHKIGNGRGPVIPKDWREKLDVDEEDTLDAEVDFEAGTITYHI